MSQRPARVKRELGISRKREAREDEDEEEEQKQKEANHIDTRVKSQGDHVEQFQRGSIKYMYMKNFLTFTEVEMQPGPTLNMVIGPNGAGKSTIVNAICVGLAGKLTLLSRSNKLRDFIKHGENAAVVEIHIHDPKKKGSMTKVRRQFDDDNHSDWFIDGKPSNEAAVKTIRSEYNIQLENLCHFLPQERVQEFSELSKQGLLEDTLKAVGGEEFCLQLSSLKKEYDALKTDARIGETDQQRLEELRKKNARIATDVALFRKRAEIVKRLDDLKMIRPWKEFDDYRRKTKAQRKSVAEFERRKAKKIDELEQAREKLIPLRRQADGRKAETKQLESAKAELEKTTQTIMAEIEELEISHGNEAKHIQDAQNQAKRRKHVIEQLQKEITELQAEASELASPEEIERKGNEFRVMRDETDSALQELKEELERKRRQTKNLDREVYECEVEIKKLENRRLQKLRQISQGGFSHAEALVQWIEENRDQFRTAIYGPVALEVSVDNDYHGRVLESVVPPWLRNAFIFESSDDMIQFRSEMDRKRWRVDTVTVPTDPAFSTQGRHDLRQLKPLGLYNYLIELFEAPESVKRALAANASVHEILVGDKNAITNQSKILDAQVRAYFTPEAGYNVKISRYSGLPSIRTDALRKGDGIFAGIVDEANVRLNIEQRKHQAIQSRERHAKEMEELQYEQQRHTQKLSAIQLELEKLRRQRMDISRVQNALEGKMSRMRQLRSDADRGGDASQEIQGAVEEMKKIEKNMVNLSLQMPAELEKYAKVLKDLDLKMVSLFEARIEYEILEGTLESFEHAARQAEQALEKEQAVYEKMYEKLGRLKDVASSAVEDITVVKDVYNTLPDEFTLEQLDDMIRSEKARVDSMSHIQEEVIEEFERRERQIKKLENIVANASNEIQSRRTELDRKRTELVTELKSKIDFMSARFSELYSMLGCRGEIDLIGYSPDAEDLDSLEIDIKVAYRAGLQLQSLNGMTQSGGERMVATMMYLFSLHEITPAPFRVVDEMNQGMDADNERKILSMMIEDARKHGNPQMFLVTPKLLLGLEFNDSTITHVIINGDADARELFRLVKRMRVS